MKIVRAYWGNDKRRLNEIPKKPLFDDETVFVWGQENVDYFHKLGYSTNHIFRLDNTELKKYTSKEALNNYIQSNKNNYTDPRYSHHLKHYAHKLEVLKRADQMFDEYLFLDWDISLAKPLDNNFYNLIRSKGNFQCPLYCYQNTWAKDVINTIPNLSSDSIEFILIQSEQLNKFHWEKENKKVLPCACFIYSNKANKGQELLDIFNKYNLTCCIEEYAIHIMANCSLEEYIQKYEPLVLNGKEYDRYLDKMSDSIKELNKYVSTKLNKNIYLYHDL